MKALYLRPPQRLRGTLADQLGLARTETGLIQTDPMGRTSVVGVSAAGAGATAAAFLNHDLVLDRSGESFTLSPIASERSHAGSH